MKINKLFHWLYAFLMGLPLLSSLWIGLIWTFNENAQVPTITENVSREVDFNQINNRVISTSYWSNYGINVTYDSATCNLVASGTATSGTNSSLSNGFNLVIGHKYYCKVSGLLDTDFISLTNWSYTYSDNIFTCNSNSPEYRWRINFNANQTINTNCYLQLFDLTQMFGYGNEPTKTEFNVWFTELYYPYIKSQHIVIEDYSTRQVLDSPVNYIWLPSFGGMGWTIQNVFNNMVNNMFGLATSYGIGLTIVKLLTYWLCISLIWLIYDVIMYVPLMIHRWLDKGVIS